MSTRVQTPGVRNRLSALRAEQRAMVEFAESLTDDEWNAPSAASGWRVGDVVAHLGALSRSMYAPAAALAVLRADDIERENDRAVDHRRQWTRSRVVMEYKRSSSRLSAFASVVTRSPLAPMRMPLAGVGRFPFGQMMTGAMVFDHHTHLRHDVIPVLDRPEPATDEHRMSVVTAWMVTVLDEQIRRTPLTWLAAPVSLSLAGPGGGTWVIGAHGVLRSRDAQTSAAILAPAVSFPAWGTKRVPWRESDVQIKGDVHTAGRFLDAVNVV